MKSSVNSDSQGTKHQSLTDESRVLKVDIWDIFVSSLSELVTKTKIPTAVVTQLGQYNMCHSERGNRRPTDEIGRSNFARTTNRLFLHRTNANSIEG